MKKIFLVVALTTLSFSGFFNEESNSDVEQKKHLENQRLCKIFTQKVEKYKKTMRDDALAIASLVSYENRAALFCKKAESAKKL